MPDSILADPIADLIQRRPELAACEASLNAVADLLCERFAAGKTLLICGNGGSAADAEHWSGELLKGFERRPPPAGAHGLPNRLGARLQAGLPVIPLSGFPALRTAVANDCHPSLEFAQLVVAFGKPGDVLIGISTSGRARNVRYAAKVARARGLATIALTGGRGLPLADHCDLAIKVPAATTAGAQELHLPVYHALCRVIEQRLFPTV